MEPQHLKFGGGVSESVVNPIVLMVVLIAGVLIFFWPRNKIFVVFLAASVLIPMDQILLVGGLHFPMLRLLALFGVARMAKETVSNHRIFGGGMNKLDWVVILLTAFIAVNAIVLFREAGAAIFQFGNLYTVFGVYFLLRFLLRDEQDIDLMIHTLAYIAAFIALIMVIEQTTGHNPYALLGGANASFYADLMERDGRFRATGCFAHPLLAGAFGAILVPLFVYLWWRGRQNRFAAMIGIASSTVIVLTSNSSTPILTYAAGVLALCLWPLRNWMRAVRWGVFLTVVALHIVMKAPVWHLIARIDISGGSSSYHRFMLVDQCISHFGDWWLIGVKSTAEWGWGMWDTCNQFVSTAEASGILPLILFVSIFVCGFKYLGRARKRVGNKGKQVLLWALGASLFANAIAFWGISYSDQIIVVWYGLLASICAAITLRPRRDALGRALQISDESAMGSTETPVPTQSSVTNAAIEADSLPQA